MLGYDVEIFEANGEKTISTSYPNIYILLETLLKNMESSMTASYTFVFPFSDVSAMKSLLKRLLRAWKPFTSLLLRDLEVTRSICKNIFSISKKKLAQIKIINSLKLWIMATISVFFWFSMHTLHLAAESPKIGQLPWVFKL